MRIAEPPLGAKNDQVIDFEMGLMKQSGGNAGTRGISYYKASDGRKQLFPVCLLFKQNENNHFGFSLTLS